MYKRILMACDGSTAGKRALLECVDIAQWSKSNLYLLAVRPEWLMQIAVEANQYQTEVVESRLEHYQEILESAVAILAADGLAATGLVVIGDPVSEIVTYAKRISADLIIVGQDHCDSWLNRWWGRPVSEKLLEVASCSVLVAISNSCQ